MKELSTNRKAYYDYFILEKFEAGIKLLGSEVKPVLSHKMGINNSFIKVIKNEVFLFDSNIPNDNTTYYYLRHKEDRERKLLLKKKEIFKINEFIKNNQNSTIIPLKVYYSDSRKIKLEIALCKGKKNYDKKQAIKERDIIRYNKEQLHEF